jgi:hypothetical protein
MRVKQEMMLHVQEFNLCRRANAGWLVVLLFAALTLLPDVFAYGDATNDPGTPYIEPNEVAPPLLFIPIILALFVALVLGIFLVGLGAALAAALIALAGGLTIFGIVSTSVVIGALKKSVGTGFRALFLQVGVILGIPMGIGSTWLFTWVLHLEWSLTAHLVGGALGGAIGGLLVACLFNLSWSGVVAWLLRRHERKSGSSTM